MKSTIAVSKEVKEKLDRLKVHPRETYEDVIKRLIERWGKSE
ncbi:MAG: antitoxin VapB family protein [Nitrososphaeria archaeon]